MKENKKTGEGVPRLSRRTFIKSLGVSSVGVVTAKGSGIVGELERTGILGKDKILGPGPVRISLTVNGRPFSVSVEPRTTLAEVIRESLSLTGTKTGCERGACGACTVLLEGKAVPSCMILALDVSGRSIETIEGLSSRKEELHPIQEAFIEADAMQCGFCTSGMIMSSKGLLDANKNPTLHEIKTAVSGNMCRCGTYPHVFKAVQSAAGKMK